MTSDLTSIPNVGPAVARKLQRLGISSLDDLRGQDGEELYERFGALEGRAQDPCLLDTFVAIVAYARGGPARPWWEYSRERKARAHA
jgi:Pathogenicity locus